MIYFREIYCVRMIEFEECLQRLCLHRRRRRRHDDDDDHHHHAPSVPST